MITASINRTLVRLGSLGALVGVTVLLTLLFSILGNITCAIVSGLIFGAAKRWQWQALPCCLVFPAVLLLLSYYSRVELPAGKLLLVALLSGGAFWGMVGLMFGLRFAERKPGGPSTSDNTSTQFSGPPVFELNTLRGSWTCEEPRDGLVQSRTLLIQEGRFMLTERTRRGRDRIVARGEVSSGPSQPNEIIFKPEPVASPHSPPTDA